MNPHRKDIHSNKYQCHTDHGKRQVCTALPSTLISLSTLLKNAIALTKLVFLSTAKYLSKTFLPCAFRGKHEISI